MKENNPNVNLLVGVIVRSRGITMLIAGDIGGTKTLLGLFEPASPRPRSAFVRSFGTLDHPDLPSMIADFLEQARTVSASISGAAFGVAGPVIDDAATLTNVPWKVDARAVRRRFGFARVALLNDLEAMAYSVPVLQETELYSLQDGEATPHGNIALIAAGTGLGEALLHKVGDRYIPSASEGGHADFAARTEIEIELLRDVTARYGRADVEHVVSGRGLLNIFRVTHKAACAAGIDPSHPDAPAAISAAALESRCSQCKAALDLLIEAYGAEAGNHALRTVATGGVFVGGGIAPKILPGLTTGAFMRAFRAKAPLDGLLSRMPVRVILNDETGLIGAATYAGIEE